MTHKEFIKNIKIKYKKIRYVECPVFNGEKIYFTNKGFNHLLKKGRKYRSREEQVRRLSLLKYVRDILETSRDYHTYRFTEAFHSKVHFWSFEKKGVVVVVCQINNEPKIFISIMDKR